MRMSVHMVLMSSEDGTLRWKPSRIWKDREEKLTQGLATIATRQYFPPTDSLYKNSNGINAD